MRNLLIMAVLASMVLATSCVSNKKYTELESNKNALQEQYDLLSKKYNDVVDKYNALIASNTDLQQSYEELSSDYAGLRKASAELANMTEDELRKLNAQLNQKIASLQQTQQKVNELEQAISRQNMAVANILKTIKDALVGYDADDLNVYTKDGQVYVSLSEDLLFKSGSYAIDTKGKEALGKLAVVLKEQKDIEIAVEGHTDNVPYKGGEMLKDNWDLSVKRATTIVRVLTQDYGAQPSRITASGKGEHYPVASNDSAEGRQQNRRTDIIITPNLSEIMNMVGAAK